MAEKTTTEMKLKLSNGQIVGAYVAPDGTCHLEIEIASVREEEPKISDVFKKLTEKIVKRIKYRY